MRQALLNQPQDESCSLSHAIVSYPIDGNNDFAERSSAELSIVDLSDTRRGKRTWLFHHLSLNLANHTQLHTILAARNLKLKLRKAGSRETIPKCARVFGAASRDGKPRVTGNEAPSSRWRSSRSPWSPRRFVCPAARSPC